MSGPIQPLTFNPGPQACDGFQKMFGPAEISPIGGYAGNSHFGYVQPLHPAAQNPGWHITTEISGLNQGTSIVHRDFLSDMNI